MSEARLTSDALDRWLAAHRGWTVDQSRLAIEQRFVFAGFPQAFAFMTAVAFAAERLGHHPEWTNVYDRVDVRLTTHDAGGLTARDLELAELIDAQAKMSS